MVSGLTEMAPPVVCFRHSMRNVTSPAGIPASSPFFEEPSPVDMIDVWLCGVGFGCDLKSKYVSDANL